MVRCRRFYVYPLRGTNDNYYTVVVKSMIIGDAVNLRPFDLGDAGFLFEWMNDPEYTGIFEPFETVTKEELEDW
jgi:hypothetical protein